jgi:hypothetical protein
MKTETTTLLHRLLWALVPYNLLVMAIGLWDFVQHPTALSPYAPFDGAAWFRVFCVLTSPIYLGVSYLVIRRARNNLIGLLMFMWSGGALSFGVSVELDPVLYNLVSITIPLWWASVFFLPYYFPNGRAFPRWMNPLVTFIMFCSVVAGVILVITDPTLPLVGNPANPWHIPKLAPQAARLIGLFALTWLPFIPGVFVSPFLRYRQAGYQERQQMKWLLLFGGAFVPYLIVYFIGVAAYPDYSQAPDWMRFVYSLYILYIAVFPALAVGNAILRHNLYQVDIIIRKTLVYSILTGILAIIYFGGVVLAQQLFKAATGQTSDLAIVVSTLLIAALFSPLRRHIQNTIDRRFYRRKYDAEQTLARFNQTLRDEVDIETLKAQLIDVVNDTMQPTKVALWIPEK